ncbi:MAG: phosphatidate cytidylyltransferase [Mariprofundaceae bacterium]
MALLMLSARSQESASVVDWTFRLGLGYWIQVWLLLFVWVLVYQHQQVHGSMFLFGAFIAVWAADIGAYFAGRACGKRKLCASVSPGKTVEGALAGSICGIAAATVIWVVYAQMAVLTSLLIALALVLTAILGDLMESAIKRAVNVKDSGRTLPGHGGLLDRVDALLPAVALAGILEMGL